MDESVRVKLSAIVSQKAIAQGLGVTPQAVNQWFTKSAIPPRFVLKLCEFVGWVVTPHELRPDLYPSKLDGMPRA
ncbi:helix-turn-helix domain-containing protein [Klebsiella aerogenes]|uniref:transcriptional regulator n=1 Tax=Klebsiella aerogenes TaxID=548 RepID=UPI00090204E1|nr:YdaS family helix-turn-helix protein [Klebsiella aerogenes]AUY89007.1 helix-turn-helix domain-containing protein [Klebsiella aerogenes]EKY0564461.1 helix-turn-helix domain-containing protein [Klebsiella aerogenes]ELA1600779.1 helix-turn-helix domain-containing protein [Klebsiella aerogenes]ELA1744688.1 helix-turn-helix domain-containing protein [Klebsiella aerogenes]ELB6541948.1 helix-turn-helix domain-containing protein [Klebsiella aerogenes]